MSNKVDDYLEHGMYGPRETKRSERKEFLGTIRERIVIALTQSQVRERGVNKQVEDAIKENSTAHLYLNGHMYYESLSKYTKIATEYHVYYTIVTNKEHNSEIGLVLAYDYAIDKEEIYVEKEIPIPKPQKSSKNRMFTFLTKIFKIR